ncbi:hypothetical protein BDW59DRAFT_162143 [Aspergillus cavernicola]|uniref:Uncharacterized protein n=1 Tax=Aspergillus cavernicola TaxID=176166 RepID=A0ABR4IDD9_9EURO
MGSNQYTKAHKVPPNNSSRTRKVSFSLEDPYGVCVSWYEAPESDDKKRTRPKTSKKTDDKVAKMALSTSSSHKNPSTGESHKYNEPTSTRAAAHRTRSDDYANHPRTNGYHGFSASQIPQTETHCQQYYPTNHHGSTGYTTGGVYAGVHPGGWYTPSYNYNAYSGYTAGYSYAPYYTGSGNVCGHPQCGRAFICVADYNRNIQYRYMGYSGGR